MINFKSAMMVLVFGLMVACGQSPSNTTTASDSGISSSSSADETNSSTATKIQVGDYSLDVEALDAEATAIAINGISVDVSDLSDAEAFNDVIREALSASVGSSKASAISDEIVYAFQLLISNFFGINLSVVNSDTASSSTDSSSTTSDDSSTSSTSASNTSSLSGWIGIVATLLQLFI